METQTVVTKAAEWKHTEVRGLACAVGFFFSFRTCIVLLSVQLFGLEASTGTAISLGLDLLLFGLICFNTVGASSRTLRSVFQTSPSRWVLAFFALSGLSFLWSESASLANSAAYWSGLVIDVANVALLLRCGSATEEAHSILKGFVWSTCCLALIAWCMPTAADLRLGDEQYFNPNQIGNLCAFAIFFAQYLARSEASDWRLPELLLVITLIRSLSKATLAAFLVSESVLLLMDKSMSRKTKMLVLGFGLLLLLAFWGLFAAYYDYYTNNGNQAETLTGRLVIWLYVLSGVTEHPWTLWIGHGFDSWWKVVPPFGGELFEARHAENELLQQLYAYGAAGVVILLGIYSSLFRQLRRAREDPAKIVLLCFLAFIAVRGLAESDAFDLLLPLWAIVLIGTLAAPRHDIEQGA